ncbi:MAG: cellulase family glycosylhydrolase, partial [Anaerolineae bacterium]|nr:cellulase family glycosylhydrolase [Anaerolineae bacterium]MCB0237708.1 cellulase family glycosylhydrolase [Anaerolineae bacterium]
MRSISARRLITILILASLLLVSGLVVFAGIAANDGGAQGWLFSVTGEEALLPQLKGLSDLAAGALRARVQTADLEPVRHAGVNPFGVNVFLEQEVEPAKREQAVRMAAEAGFHWLRQEFPWEDIEIHGKGDFTDRRNEPAKSAWEKYDNIVDLAEQYDMELIVRLSNPPSWTRAAGDAAGTYAPPDNYDDFGDFVAAVVERYKGRVQYYQIWNEPNIYP